MGRGVSGGRGCFRWKELEIISYQRLFVESLYHACNVGVTSLYQLVTYIALVHTDLYIIHAPYTYHNLIHHTILNTVELSPLDKGEY